MFTYYLNRVGNPGEIKRRDVSWTLTKKLDFHLRVKTESRGETWCWTLKRAQKLRAREAELGSESSDLSFASVVPQQQCYGHCPCDRSAPYGS